MEDGLHSLGPGLKKKPNISLETLMNSSTLPSCMAKIASNRIAI